MRIHRSSIFTKPGLSLLCSGRSRRLWRCWESYVIGMLKNRGLVKV